MTEELHILKTDLIFVVLVYIYRCDWKPTCTLVASNDLFGNPCKSTYKYIEVLFYCLGKDQACSPKIGMHLGCIKQTFFLLGYFPLQY